MARPRNADDDLSRPRREAPVSDKTTAGTLEVADAGPEVAVPDAAPIPLSPVADLVWQAVKAAPAGLTDRWVSTDLAVLLVALDALSHWEESGGGGVGQRRRSPEMLAQVMRTFNDVGLTARGRKDMGLVLKRGSEPEPESATDRITRELGDLLA